MKSWPPSSPETKVFVPALMHMKENIQQAVHIAGGSSEDINLAQYMRTKNVEVGLMRETEGAYAKQMVVLFDTITSRDIRSELLRVFRLLPDEDGVFIAPTNLTHSAINGVSQKEAGVLADELISGFYEQFEIAKMMEISKNELSKISPIKHQEQLRKIYDEIRQRSLMVIED